MGEAQLLVAPLSGGVELSAEQPKRRASDRTIAQAETHSEAPRLVAEAVMDALIG